MTPARRQFAERARRAAAAAALGLVLPALAAAQAGPPAVGESGFTRTEAAAAILRADRAVREVKLIGRATDGGVVFSDGGVARRLEAAQVESAYFPIELDGYAVYQDVRRRNWLGAAGRLLTAIKPTLPYLDLPNNNTADLAIEAGNHMLRAARDKAAAAATDEDRQTAEARYKTAYTIFQHASRAEWYSGGQIAALRLIQCLAALEKPRTARQELERAERPMPGDAAYGLYWLVTAQLALGREEYQPAMDAAVNSLCFDNKNMDTFPDALLISARCYEEFQDWHRARDVYYEVARIFPMTEWADAARARLTHIMDKGLTAEKEKLLIEDVFFGLNEDINQLARELLASTPTDPFADEKISVPQAKPQPAEKAVDLDEKETE